MRDACLGHIGVDGRGAHGMGDDIAIEDRHGRAR